MAVSNDIPGLVQRAREWMLGRIQRTHPWAGLGGLPVRVTDGKPYEGTNIPLLWMQQEALRSESNAWGTYQMFLRRGEPVTAKQQECTAIRFHPFGRMSVAEGEVAGQVREAEVHARNADMTLPVSLYNLAQTSARGPAYIPVMFPGEGRPDDIPGLVTDVLLQHDSDGVSVLPGERAFIDRFTRDVVRMLHGSDPASIEGAYPAEAVESLAAQTTDLKKLCGICAAVIRNWGRLSQPVGHSAMPDSVPVIGDGRAAEEAFDRILGIVTYQGVVQRRAAAMSV
ncbi:ArdC-like ssDNA-binding domain-containing protein [Paraburkholderia fungorum]|uniref:ArdC-like ssDNA-binding domain-containing protein n=1 Tax=Paraburkholderia fungorum TaxID=134537 RepID=UPI002093F19F|nr:ArdC family protein [Paraburkholderia fungorum]USU29745.1 ArdC family protein [Paraburkholderia fungorum]